MRASLKIESSTPADRSVPASLSSLPGLLALEQGHLAHGTLRGSALPAEGELIFSTAAAGWGEILTDPSYAGQIVVLTHPMVGSYRIDPAELESDRIHVRALVVTRLVTPPAGPGLSLEELAATAGVPILEGIDTRALTLLLRRGAARRAVIRAAGDELDAATAVAEAARSPRWDAVDHVELVSTTRPYLVPPTGERRGSAVLLNFGVKRSLLDAITARGFATTVLPHDASPDDVAAQDPDLVVLSPGPGDPARMARQIATVRSLAATAEAGGPALLGICLGHQLLALAAGAATRRLAVGHHGGNHAVRETATGRVDISAHNHEVAVVDGPTLAAAGYEVSHRDLNDGSIEGLAHASGRIRSVQFHPEGAPGPIDAARIFDVAINAAMSR